MIIGTIIRNIKTYSGLNYVPLTYGQNFNGIVGNNGIGKSSVLEALDSFFNNRHWNHNIITKKSGFSTTRPHIVPIFMLSMDSISADNIDLAKNLSKYVWNLQENDVLSQNRGLFKTLAYHFLKSYRKNTQNIILAIDEPESSLHMSACYDQFNKLYEVSLLCKQLIFTTHWYGFIPTIEDGCVCVISKAEEGHVFDLVGVSSYREEVKQAVKLSKGKLPFDIRLKSINDFTQSIVTSILTDEPYNWLICEGSSEKIYFEKYFSDIKQDKKLRIIPVGGAVEIKRVYNNLQVAYEDFKKEVKGKVILL